ncbi:sce7726 family protein [Clostridium butyricum]
MKSNFINNVLLKSNNHVTIFELNLSSSRVDLCKINGKSVAFEIKTDLDNFLRLKKQLNDYSKIFEEVYVICSKANLKNIFNLIPIHCGVYSYYINSDGIYTFKKEKKALYSKALNNAYQLNLFSKKDLIKNFKKCNNNSTKPLIIDEILLNYSYKYINSIFKKLLKSKYKAKWNFLKENHDKIYEIDYQWFFKNNINPNIVYQQQYNI